MLSVYSNTWNYKDYTLDKILDINSWLLKFKSHVINVYNITSYLTGFHDQFLYFANTFQYILLLYM